MGKKVEFRKTCKLCEGEIKIPRFRSYCSNICRSRWHSRANKLTSAEWLRNKKKREAMAPSAKKIQCMVCGGWYKQVGSHVVLAHGYETAREYRKEYGFDLKRGQLPEWLRKIKEEHCVENGTIKNLKKGKKFWFKLNDTKAGKYERSPQTLDRLRHMKQLFSIKK